MRASVKQIVVTFLMLHTSCHTDLEQSTSTSSSSSSSSTVVKVTGLGFASAYDNFFPQNDLHDLLQSLQIEEDTILTNFRRDQYLFLDDVFSLPLQVIDSSNPIIKVKGIEYSLDGAIPAQVFSPRTGASIFLDGMPIFGTSLPEVNLYVKETLNETFLITKDDTNNNDDIQSITIFYKNINEPNVDLVRVTPDGIFLTIEGDDIDYSRLNQLFVYGGLNTGGSVDVNDNISSTSSVYQQYSKVSDIGEGSSDSEVVREFNLCNTYREIDLAVAFDSSFCHELGGYSASITEIARIISGVSLLFQQKGICMKIYLSHIEGYCDDFADIYKSFLNMNKPVCGDEGLLGLFQDFWENERTEVTRNAAHLFSGSRVECGPKKCKLGCSHVASLCTDKAYAAYHVTYTDNPSLRTQLVARELAHNCGAENYPQAQEGYLMHNSIGDTSFGFTNKSIIEMNEYFSSVTFCLPKQIPGQHSPVFYDDDDGDDIFIMMNNETTIMYGNDDVWAMNNTNATVNITGNVTDGDDQGTLADFSDITQHINLDSPAARVTGVTVLVVSAVVLTTVPIVVITLLAAGA